MPLSPGPPFPSLYIRSPLCCCRRPVFYIGLISFSVYDSILQELCKIFTVHESLALDQAMLQFNLPQSLLAEALVTKLKHMEYTVPVSNPRPETQMGKQYCSFHIEASLTP